jgi:hypothetical protein
MRRGHAVVLTVICCHWLTGCKAEKNLNDVSSVIYTSDSGSILPELQWHERYTITRNKVILARNGKTANTRINEGTWEVNLGEQKVDSFFAQIEALDCSNIRRIEPADVPDGGGTESYTIVTGKDKEFSLIFDPGTSYEGGALIVNQTQAFIKNLSFPGDSGNRYKPGHQ